MDDRLFVFKNKQNGEYWICKGKTVPDMRKATKFNPEQAARFFRTVSHPNKWIKEEYLFYK